MGATMAKVYTPDMPRYLREGLAELTHGIDDRRTYKIITLAKSVNADFLSTDVFIAEEPKNQYVEYSYAGGYMLLRYFAKQVRTALMNLWAA